MLLRPQSFPASVACGGLLIMAGLFSGCLSARYQRAPKDAPPAEVFGASANTADLDATIESIIVFRGPGSWKRNAYWDEYVITVTNRGVGAITVESVSLVGLAGRAVAPGEHPWPLEKASREAAKRGYDLPDGNRPLLGAGWSVKDADRAAGAQEGARETATFPWWDRFRHGAMIGAAAVVIIVVPLAAPTTVYRNVSHRYSIDHEFSRRRLHLPARMDPAQSVHGSLFFPITPGPRELTLRCTTEAGPVDVLIDLTKLGQLHLAKLNPP